MPRPRQLDDPPARGPAGPTRSRRDRDRPAGACARRGRRRAAGRALRGSRRRRCRPGAAPRGVVRGRRPRRPGRRSRRARLSRAAGSGAHGPARARRWLPPLRTDASLRWPSTTRRSSASRVATSGSSGGRTWRIRRETARPRSTAARTPNGLRSTSARSTSSSTSRVPWTALAVCRSMLPNCAWYAASSPSPDRRCRCAAPHRPFSTSSRAWTYRVCSRVAMGSAACEGPAFSASSAAVSERPSRCWSSAGEQRGRPRLRLEPVGRELVREPLRRDGPGATAGGRRAGRPG